MAAAHTVRRSFSRNPDELMLTLASLSVRELTRAMEPGFLEPRSGLNGLANAGNRDGVDAGGHCEKERKARKPTAKKGAAKKGWAELLGEVSESSKRVRVAQGGRIGSAEGRQRRQVEASSSGPGPEANTASSFAPQGSTTSVAETLRLPPAGPSSGTPAASPRTPDPRPPTTARTATARSAAAVTGSVATQSVGESRLQTSGGLTLSGSPRTPGGLTLGGASGSNSPAPATPRGPPTPRPTEHPTVDTAGPGVSLDPYTEAGQSLDTDIWQSYRIDEEKVPDEVLGQIWRKSLARSRDDRRATQEEVPALPRVPRLTATRREVQQLPVVHGIDYWRQVNKKKREQQKLIQDSENHPSLHEMLHIIFGDQSPPKLRLMTLRKQMRQVIDRQRTHSSLTKWLQGPSTEEGPPPSTASTSALEAVDEGADQELSVELQDSDKAEPAEEPKEKTGNSSYHGVRRGGRRNAVDLGQPKGQQLVLPEKPKAQGRPVDAKLMKGLEALKAAGSADDKLDKAQEVLAASGGVQDRAMRRVQRMHNRFLRKQIQLSGRLERRVQRLQMDYQEIHDKKVDLILPGSVAASRSNDVTSRSSHGSSESHHHPSVLAYLEHQRRRVERERQVRHLAYLHQVDRFQGRLRLLADPHRQPERGEVYVSECFRHVLSAGFLVDDYYFLRVLARLEAEDFERTATVNLLAACCDAFAIDLRQYWAFLEDKRLPKRTPRRCAEMRKSWNEEAPWSGVGLEDSQERLPDSEELLSGVSTSGDNLPYSARDPLPFGPVMPAEDHAGSELASRDEPLQQILNRVALDSVLERYHLQKPPKQTDEQQQQPLSDPPLEDTQEEEADVAEDAPTVFQPPSTDSVRARRPPVRGRPTLRATRGLGEQLALQAARRGGGRAQDNTPRARPLSAPRASEGLRPVLEGREPEQLD